MVLFMMLLLSGWNMGRATEFGPAETDPYNIQDVLKCVWKDKNGKTHFDGRGADETHLKVTPEMLGVALQEWMAPCGAKILIWGPKGMIVVRVIDRGNRSARRARYKNDASHFAIDITKAVGDAIGVNGDGQVLWKSM